MAAWEHVEMLPAEIAAVIDLQGDASQLWNEMTRLPDTDFMYKALPAGPHKQASKLPANPMNAQRQTIASEDKIAVSSCASLMHGVCRL